MTDEPIQTGVEEAGCSRSARDVSRQATTGVRATGGKAADPG
jgi:hypothetical protein